MTLNNVEYILSRPMLARFRSFLWRAAPRYAIDAIAEKAEKRRPFLVYLYYPFDRRPAWFRALCASNNGVRLHRIAIATPPTSFQRDGRRDGLARLAALLRVGIPHQSLPLSWYADKSFYVMRNRPTLKTQYEGAVIWSV